MASPVTVSPSFSSGSNTDSKSSITPSIYSPFAVGSGANATAGNSPESFNSVYIAAILGFAIVGAAIAFRR